MVRSVLDIDGTLGKAAIYTVDDATPGDRAPLLDPITHLDRVSMHTDFNYVRVIEDRTLTVTLTGPGTLQLFAHGRPGTPLVFGLVELKYGLSRYFAGPTPPGPPERLAWWPLGAGAAGTIRLNWAVGGASQYEYWWPTFGRMLSLGSDTTHVLLRATGYPSSANVTEQMTFRVRVLVTDEVL